MNTIQIEVAENGFVLRENDLTNHIIGRQWAFESAATLAAFTREWGEGNTKVTTMAENGNKET